MKALAIAGVNLRRLFRERNQIFFVIFAPMILVFMLGLVLGGGGRPQLGLVGGDQGPLSDRLVKAVGTGTDVEVQRTATEDDLKDAIDGGRLQAGLVIPPGYDRDVRAGRHVALRYVTRPGDKEAADLGMRVRSAVAREGVVLRAAGFGVAEKAGTFDETLAAATRGAATGVRVEVSTTGRSQFPDSLSAFDVTAPSLLMMFIFLTSMTAAINLVETRKSGVGRRMYATPTSASVIIAGEALGRLAVALTQGLVIIVGSALLFSVNWGDPLGSATLLLVFALASSGAALLLGTLSRNWRQALSVGMILGIVLPPLGGTLYPLLESFGPTMRALAALTPHSWGYEGFARLIRHDAGVLEILPQLAVLTCFAAVLKTLGVLSLRRRLTTR